MDVRFLAHNAHLENADAFAAMDPHLRYLAGQPFVHHSDLLGLLPTGTPGIYTISGGRQIGKTTLLKQWMQYLLERGIPADDIAFFTGELIDDHHSLVSLLTAHLEVKTSTQYVVVDEVSYISGWDKGIKYLADAGMLDNVILVLTGSDSVVIQEARMRFPGRRGVSDVVDFVLHPLTFRDVVCLKGLFSKEEQAILDGADVEVPASLVERLFAEFNNYLIHGGFLTAINDLAANGVISKATLVTYSDWIRGDVIKRGRQEAYLREVLASVIRHQGSQVTWTNMAQDLSIDHPKTVSDYCALLDSMDVLVVQAALVEDKLVEAPKKPRRLHFADPFIYHAAVNWLNPVKEPFQQQIVVSLQDVELVSKLVESVVVSHVRRRFPTFYIKAEGEVDVAWIQGGRFFPLEVKWTGQLRAKDLKQVKKYPNSRIWARQNTFSNVGDIPVEPLPLALWRFDCADSGKY